MFGLGVNRNWGVAREGSQILAVCAEPKGNGIVITDVVPATWSNALSLGASELAPKEFFNDPNSALSGIREADLLEISERHFQKVLPRPEKNASEDAIEQHKHQIKIMLNRFRQARAGKMAQARQELAPLKARMKKSVFWTHISPLREFKNTVIKPIHMRKNDRPSQIPGFMRTQLEEDVFYRDSVMTYAVFSGKIDQTPDFKPPGLDPDATAPGTEPLLKVSRSPFSAGKKHVIGAAVRQVAARGEAVFWENAGFAYPHVSLRPIADANLFLKLGGADHSNVLLAMFDERGSDFIHLVRGALQFHRWTPVSPLTAPAQFDGQLMNTIRMTGSRPGLVIHSLPLDAKINHPAGAGWSEWDPLHHAAVHFADASSRELAERHPRLAMVALGLAVTPFK